MGRETIPVFLLPSQKRTSVSPVIFILLAGLFIYFAWLDIALFITLHFCANIPGESIMSSSISVKSIMLPPTVHYMDDPISEWLELHFSLSLFFSPNFVSLLGVLFGLMSAWLVTKGTRSTILGAVFLYKIRDLCDALDGVLARGVGAIIVPTPGTTGYYVDGWCDVASDTALILATGYLLETTKNSPHQKVFNTPSKLGRWLDPIINHPFMSKILYPISMPIFFLGVQSILSAVFWNWTTTQLHILLETGSKGVTEEQVTLFKSSTCWLVMFFWRLLNPHMLSQALLVSFLVDRYKQWVEQAIVVVSIPLIILCTASSIWIFVLQSKLYWI